MQLTLDPDEDLIQVPLVAGPRPMPAKPVRKARAELEAPSPNALIGDNHAAFGKDQLDVAKTQAKHVVKPDRMADQLGREAVTVVRVWRLLHPTILPHAGRVRQAQLP